MAKIRLTIILLALLLTAATLTLVSMATPAYRISDKTLDERLALHIAQDEVLLSHLFSEIFSGIRQVSSKISDSNDLLIGTMTGSAEMIMPELEEVLSGQAGERIDALVVENGDGSMLDISNVSLFGLGLPLRQLSMNYTPYGSWGVVTTEHANKHYVLLKLTLPIIEPLYGEVTGRLHTLVLMNDNFWILNEMQSALGADAVELSLAGIALGSLPSNSSPKLTGSPSAQSDANGSNHHSLTFDSDQSFDIHVHMPDVETYNTLKTRQDDLGRYLTILTLLCGLSLLLTLFLLWVTARSKALRKKD